MLSDEGQARDATQEIFIKIMLNLARFTEQSSFSTWVYSITYNFCIDIIRKRKKMPTIYSDDMGRVSRDTEEFDDIPDSVLFEMEEKRLKEVLEAMPPGDRAILMMKYAEDLSIKEIGDVLNKTESAIKMQIMRAKHKAQAIYVDMFGKAPITETGIHTREPQAPANDT